MVFANSAHGLLSGIGRDKIEHVASPFEHGLIS